jgi:hypothetical protein
MKTYSFVTALVRMELTLALGPLRASSSRSASTPPLHLRPRPSMPFNRTTSVSDPQTLTERFPVELLERIFVFTSVRDIIRW